MCGTYCRLHKDLGLSNFDKLQSIQLPLKYTLQLLFKQQMENELGWADLSDNYCLFKDILFLLPSNFGMWPTLSNFMGAQREVALPSTMDKM